VLRQLKLDINLPTGLTPFLQRPPSRCVVFADARFIVLDAGAILALRKG